VGFEYITIFSAGKSHLRYIELIHKFWTLSLFEYCLLLKIKNLLLKTLYIAK